MEKYDEEELIDNVKYFRSEVFPAIFDYSRFIEDWDSFKRYGNTSVSVSIRCDKNYTFEILADGQIVLRQVDDDDDLSLSAGRFFELLMDKYEKNLLADRADLIEREMEAYVYGCSDFPARILYMFEKIKSSICDGHLQPEEYYLDGDSCNLHILGLPLVRDYIYKPIAVRISSRFLLLDMEVNEKNRKLIIPYEDLIEIDKKLAERCYDNYIQTLGYSIALRLNNGSYSKLKKASELLSELIKSEDYLENVIDIIVELSAYSIEYSLLWLSRVALFNDEDVLIKYLPAYLKVLTSMNPDKYETAGDFYYYIRFVLTYVNTEQYEEVLYDFLMRNIDTRIEREKDAFLILALSVIKTREKDYRKLINLICQELPENKRTLLINKISSKVLRDYLELTIVKNELIASADGKENE